MALEPLKEAFEGIPGFNLGVPMHRRSLATDEARDSMDCGSREIESQKPRKRSHFWMSELFK